MKKIIDNKSVTLSTIKKKKRKYYIKLSSDFLRLHFFSERFRHLKKLIVANPPGANKK